MERVAKLVKERADIIEAKKRRCVFGGLGEVPLLSNQNPFDNYFSMTSFRCAFHPADRAYKKYTPDETALPVLFCPFQ